VPEGAEIRPMISIRDKTEHTRRRRTWTRAFSTSALKGYEPMVMTRVNQLVEHLSNQVGSVDLSQWLSYFAQVISDYMPRQSEQCFYSYDFMTDLAYS
jgi:cytochrome P450